MKTMTVLAEAPAPGIRYTPEDLLELQDDRLYELVDGELVEKDMGAESSWIGGQLFGRLLAFNVAANLGWFFGADASYRCFLDDRSRVRLPDLSFIRYGRLEGERVPKGHITVPPDLAVEVVSPNDLYSEVTAKVREYLTAGVRLVWVVDPETRAVVVHRADGSVEIVSEDGELSGEDVLPGFSCRVGELFSPRVAETGAPAAGEA
jgi:Uma2 family endonuclease